MALFGLTIPLCNICISLHSGRFTGLTFAHECAARVLQAINEVFDDNAR